MMEENLLYRTERKWPALEGKIKAVNANSATGGLRCEKKMMIPYRRFACQSEANADEDSQATIPKFLIFSIHLKDVDCHEVY